MSFSNDLLYDFISKSIEERFVLFQYINLSKISDDRFDNLVTKYENEKIRPFFEYLPNDFILLKSLKEENNQLKKQLEEMRNQTNTNEKVYNELISKLFSHANEIKITDNSKSFLYNLCIGGDLNVINNFIAPNNINFTDSSGKSLLHYSCQLGNADFVKYILGIEQTDINLKCDSDDGIKTALHFAVENNNIEILKLLLENPKIDINSKCIQKSSTSWYSRKEATIKSALIIAVEKKYLDIVKLLLKIPNIDVNFHCVLEEDYYSMGESYKIEKEGKTALCFAVEQDNIELVKLLLEIPNIDVNAKPSDGFSPLQTAAFNGYFDIVNFLLKSKKNIDVNVQTFQYKNPPEKAFLSKTILHIAIEKGNIELIKTLLSFPYININAKSAYGSVVKSPLHLAVEEGNIEIVKLLLKCPTIDINDKQVEYNYWYFKYNQNMASVNDKDKENEWKCSPNKEKVNQTALHITVANGNIKMTKILLKMPTIDINMKKVVWEDKSEGNCITCYMNSSDPMLEYPKIEEESALHIAVKNKNIEVLKLLLENENIDFNVKDSNGKTPIEVTDDEKIRKLIATATH